MESQSQPLQKDGVVRLRMCGRTLSEGMRVRAARHSWVQTGILQLPPLLSLYQGGRPFLSFPYTREAGGASGFLAAGLAEWMRAFAREGGEGVRMRLRGSGTASPCV